MVKTISTPQNWKAWADDMAPKLGARAQAAEGARTLPPETIAEAEAAGFLAAFAPPGIGGQGVPLATFLDTVRRLAHGCASSAWTLSFLALHNWLLAKFEPELQRALFAGGATPRVPAPLAPTGTARKVDGGYVIDGRWEWATGVNHADWVMVSCLVEGESAPRFCVVPIGAVEVHDVWRTAGMCATGSNTVSAKGVFAPEVMTLPALRLKLTPSPGEALHPGTTVVYPMNPVLALVACSPALGVAEAAVDWFIARMSSKMQAYSGRRQGDLAPTHLRLGEAMARVQSARAVWESATRLLEQEGPKGVGTSLATLVQIRLASANVVKLANEAVETLAASAGASAAFLDMPLQRHLRDLQTMRGHVAFDWDRATQVAGRIALGGEPTAPDLL